LTEEVLVDERLENVEFGACNLLRRRERETANEDRETGEQPPLLLIEEVKRPLDRCT
jgi:hypothetical protein